MTTHLARRQQVAKQLFPYLLLGGLLLAFFVVLAIAGLNLGFVGDILGFEYHFDRDGITGGLQYTLDHDRRHFLSGLYYAVLHFFFPGQAAAWYGSSILTHFINSLICFLFTDTLLRGQRRWLSFAIALVFTFQLNQIVEHFEIATGGHVKIGLSLALLSLWCYMLYVRGGRRGVLWRDCSGIAYVTAFMLYESTFLFFMLNPLIAYFEDRRNGNISSWRRWLLQNIQDSLWYPVFFLVYVGLLSIMIPPARGRFFLSHIPVNILGAFSTTLWPGNIFNQFAPLLTSDWLILVAVVALGVLMLLWAWRNLTPSTAPPETPLKVNELVYLLLMGAGMMITNIFGVAASEWYLPNVPRLIYPASVGAAIILCGAIVWFTDRLPTHKMRSIGFAVLTALLIAPGVIRFVQVQQQYEVEFTSREKVVAAVVRAVPAWQGDVPPYLLLISDRQPDELALHALDIRFPYMWDMAYGTEGIFADALYRVDNPRFPQDPPAPDEPVETYVGTYLIVEENALYSPVRPGVPIDPARLVIVYYDSATDTARVLDALPEDILTSSNIVLRADTSLMTNSELLPIPQSTSTD